MEFKYTFEGIFFTLLGIILVIFHNNIGDFAIRFREKVNEVKYDKSTRKFSRAMSLIMGVGLTIFGILVLLNKIQLG